MLLYANAVTITKTFGAVYANYVTATSNNRLILANTALLFVLRSSSKIICALP